MRAQLPEAGVLCGWRFASTLGALLAAGTAQAAMFRCTAPDGKVVYGDQACAPGQTASEVKGAATGSVTGSATAARSPSVQEFQNKAQRDRVQAALSPECRTLGDRASRALQSDASASMDEVKRAVSAFEDRCGDQVMQATRKESARVGSRLDAAACRRLRQTLDADRARLGRMTDREKMAFVAQQNEVSVACP